MTYRKILDGPNQTVVESSSAVDVNPRPSGDLAGSALSSLRISGRDDSVDDEMHHYTRVQILAQLLLLHDERQGTADTSNEFYSPPVVAPPPPQHYQPPNLSPQFAEPSYHAPQATYRDTRGVLHRVLPRQYHVPYLVNGVPAEPPSFQYRRGSSGNLCKVPYIPPAMRGPHVPSPQHPRRSPSMRVRFTKGGRELVRKPKHLATAEGPVSRLW